VDIGHEGIDMQVLSAISWCVIFTWSKRHGNTEMYMGKSNDAKFSISSVV